MIPTELKTEMGMVLTEYDIYYTLRRKAEELNMPIQTIAAVAAKKAADDNLGEFSPQRLNEIITNEFHIAVYEASHGKDGTENNDPLNDTERNSNP